MVILLTFYLKHILRLPGGRKYRYANDVIVLNVKRSLEEIIRAITKNDAAVKVLKA